MDARLFLTLHEAREEVHRRLVEVECLIREKETELAQLNVLRAALSNQEHGLVTAIAGAQQEAEHLPHLPTEVYPALVQGAVMDRRDG